jgi:hypothetical protein
MDFRSNNIQLHKNKNNIKVEKKIKVFKPYFLYHSMVVVVVVVAVV